MKLLVISFAGIGDTLLATPLIHELRLNYPSATLDVLVRWPGARHLLESNPYVNTVYQKDFIKEGPVAALGYLNALRRGGYDVSFNTYPQSKLAYRGVARVVNARKRLSHTYHGSPMLDKLFINKIIPQDYTKHSVENNLAFLDLLGVRRQLESHDTELFLTETEKGFAEQFAGDSKLKGRILFGIHVGSGKTKNLELRRWPLTRYIELIRRINALHPEMFVLLFGGPEEKEDHDHVLREIGGDVMVAPSANLRQAAALLGKCQFFLSVDTALMHLAAAMKVPHQIVIETPTFNKTIEPYNRPYLLIPNPRVGGRNLEYYKYDGRGIQGSPGELLQCMESVSVDSVLAGINRALRQP